MDTIHKMNVEREEELAYNIGEKYFAIQTSEEGYDYTFYDKYPYGKPQTDEVARGSGNREYGCRRLREKLPNFSGVSFF